MHRLRLLVPRVMLKSQAAASFPLGLWGVSGMLMCWGFGLGWKLEGEATLSMGPGGRVGSR